MFLSQVHHIGDGASKADESENDRHDYQAKVKEKD
jgi:hypothetical protein